MDIAPTRAYLPRLGLDRRRHGRTRCSRWIGRWEERPGGPARPGGPFPRRRAPRSRFPLFPRWTEAKRRPPPFPSRLHGRVGRRGGARVRARGRLPRARPSTTSRRMPRASRAIPWPTRATAAARSSRPRSGSGSRPRRRSLRGPSRRSRKAWASSRPRACTSSAATAAPP
jgi:hypothetical protein